MYLYYRFNSNIVAANSNFKPVSQEIRPPPGDSPPSQKGGDIPRIFAPPGANIAPQGVNLLGISPPPRNIAPL